MQDLSDLFWEASLEELKQGYIHQPQSSSFICLICGQSFEQGRIYNINNLLYEACKAVELHIANEHSSMFEYLLSLDKKYTGFTDHQKNVLQYFYNGYNDREIAGKLGGSPSTIRNYRFTFKEKEKQAKIFLAIMELLKGNLNKKEQFVGIHRTAKMIDERYAITEEEYDKVLKMYFKEGLDGPLSQFPTKEKRKLIILKHLIKKFDANRTYTEKEVNEKLKTVYPDYVTLRRYLIEYGFMDRTKDCSAYWVKS